MKKTTVNNLEEAVNVITSGVENGKQVINSTASIYNRERFQIIEGSLYIWNQYIVGHKPKVQKIYPEGVVIYNLSDTSIEMSIRDYFSKYLYDENYGGGDHEGDWGFQFKNPVVLDIK